jgi:fumarate reductase subunit D
MENTTITTAVPITHPSHPFWHFDWAIFLKVMQVSATVAPIVVAITDAKDPAGVLQAQQLSALTQTIAAELAVSVAPAA